MALYPGQLRILSQHAFVVIVDIMTLLNSNLFLLAVGSHVNCKLHLPEHCCLRGTPVYAESAL